MKKRFTLLISFVLIVAMAMPALAAQSDMTRLDFVKKIVEAKGLTDETVAAITFTDIYAEDTVVVAVAVYNNIAAGYGDNTFKPEKIITKEEACVMIAQAFGVAPADSVSLDTLSYTDKEGISPWAVPHVKALVASNILDNIPAPFYPKAAISELEIDNLIRKFVPEYVGAATAPLITKENLTAAEMLETSNEALKALDTYKLESKWDIAMSAMGESMNMKLEQYGSYKNPDQVHLIQNMLMDATPTSMEIVMMNDKIYMRADSLSNFEELDLTASGMTVAEMKKLAESSSFASMTASNAGILAPFVSYKDDITLDGKDYYVVAINLDQTITDNHIKPALKPIVDEYMNIMLNSYASEIELTEADKKLMDDVITSMVDSLTLTASIDISIEKETKLISAYNFSMDMGMTVSIPDAGMSVPIDFDMNGTMKIYDYNQDVSFPEIPVATEASDA